MREYKVTKQHIRDKADGIVANFLPFTYGVRVLFLIHRAKEGARSANNDKVRKVITTGTDEFVSALAELLEEKEMSELSYRIYSSVNGRDTRKAIRKFKHDQLDADYYDKDSHEAFYLDVKNRFVSCLMVPSSASSSLFLLDIDSHEDLEKCLRKIADVGLNESVVKQYPTKNGWHIVMEPFNPMLLGEFTKMINKDGLLLLDF